MPEPISREAKENFLKMAEEDPEMTCADAPTDILEAASAEAEPNYYAAKGNLDMVT